MANTGLIGWWRLDETRPTVSRRVRKQSIALMFLGISMLVLEISLTGCSVTRVAANVEWQQQTPQSRKIVFSDIAHAYHGRLLDRDFKEIKLDRVVIEQLQDSMIESLVAAPDVTEYKAADGQTVKPQITKPPLDRAYVEKILNGFKFTDDERLVIKSVLIQQGIDAAPQQEQSEYQWRLDLINERSVFFIDSKVWNPHPGFSRYLDLNLSGILERMRIRLRPDPTYADTCRENSVPVPPDWPSGPTGAWTRLMPRLPWRYNFLETGPDTEVWTYEPPHLASGLAPPDQGLCYALPRKTGEDIGLVGIICQSKRTGKACFWDNIDIDAERDADGRFPRITGEGITLRIAELKNGANLAENCTNCHRGGNAFIIHPNTVLGAPLNRHPDVRYSPIGQPHWTNPPAFSPLMTGRCASCHEIAWPTPSYCRILQKAADRTMPNTVWPAVWDLPSDAAFPAYGTPAYVEYIGYRAHIALLKTRCP